MRFSASRLKSWQRCPLAANFKYNEKHPVEAINAKAYFGTCIHKALELYNNDGNLIHALATFNNMWENPENADKFYWPRNTSYNGLKERGNAILRDTHDRLKLEHRTVLATEHAFLVPFGHHELTGYVDLLEIRQSGRGKSLLRIVDYKSSSRQPNFGELFLDIQFCADTDTEILSRRGWLKHHQVLVGEDVLTLDQQSGVSVWQPAEAVNVFPAVRQRMLAMEGKAHSSLTTMNHRWPVTHTVSGESGWRTEQRIVKSEQLTNADKVLCAAPTVNLPTDPKFSDAFVELMAWYWTEGQDFGGGAGCVIGQSPTHNPHLVARINSVLITLYGPPSTTLRGTGATPAWRVTEGQGRDVTRFYLNGAALAPLLPYVADRRRHIVEPRFVSMLTSSQLTIFINTAIDADGSTQNRCRVITQSGVDGGRERLSLLQMACSLAGIRTSLLYRPVAGNGKYAGRPSWRLSLKERRPYFRVHPRVRSEVEYTGDVWCPTTSNGTWLARRNGQVYFTGNTTYVYASLQPEFWYGNGPDFPAMNNAEWAKEMHFDLPRRAIWYHLWNQKEFDAGPRDDDDFMRLYRLCDSIEKAQNAGIFVPKIGEECSICDYKEPCGMPIPTPVEIAGQQEAWI